MRFGIIGNGKMGREIAATAARRGHEIAWTLGSAENRGGSGVTAERVRATDAVFEFTTPDSAVENLLALASRGARVVCGTTGWNAELPRVTEEFRSGSGALIHASNFSVGVRQFFELARCAGRLYAPAGYAFYLVEEHHAGKKDSPSGTARTISGLLERETGQAPPIASVRAGSIPGTHRLVAESPEDEIEIVHRARGRSGFARGAVWAAERLTGRSGVFEFGEILRESSEGFKEVP